MTQLEDKDLKKINRIKGIIEEGIKPKAGQLAAVLNGILDVIRDHQHVQAEQIDITKHGVHGEVSLKKIESEEKPDQGPEG